MDHASGMTTVSQICDLIGRQTLAHELRVGRTAISNAAVDGRFPAKWYVVVKQHCDALGVACPTELFRFAEPTLAPQSQEAAE
ncbi:hypothetical protein C5F48_20295 [Cereibacter changlensis JA139]|uniref:Uncharacterized protein n=1 Tax=Cereibacter changlensis JA139 TaxID=1188249 RepID=A0A2T4JPR9_9RHOB|nr:hypothetical protein C5F48_20295 [Cereibacter changlensis JA139]